MESHFSIAIDKIEALRSELFSAISSFRAFEVLRESRAPNIKGDETAQKNARNIGQYKGFFNIAERSMETEFFVSLAKLYDSTSGATSIPRLLNYLDSNSKYMGQEAFIKHNLNREDLEEITEEYMDIDADFIDTMRLKLESELKSIEKLKTIRDKKIAHLEISGASLNSVYGDEDIQKTKEIDSIEHLTYGEIDKLIQLALEILNEVASRLNKNVVWFGPLKDSVTGDTESLIRLLNKVK